MLPEESGNLEAIQVAGVGPRVASDACGVRRVTAHVLLRRELGSAALHKRDDVIGGASVRLSKLHGFQQHSWGTGEPTLVDDVVGIFPPGHHVAILAAGFGRWSIKPRSGDVISDAAPYSGDDSAVVEVPAVDVVSVVESVDVVSRVTAVAPLFLQVTDVGQGLHVKCVARTELV